jgi:hypothetical protein
MSRTRGQIAGHDPQLVYRARIGRRVGGGQWIVSKVALAMFLNGDDEALRLYKAGDRTSDRVVAYYKREGLETR